MHILPRPPLAGSDPYTAGLTTRGDKSAANSLSSMALQKWRRSPLSTALFGMFIDSLERVMRAVPQHDAPTLATASCCSYMQMTLCSQPPPHRACSGFWRHSNASVSAGACKSRRGPRCLSLSSKIRHSRLSGMMGRPCSGSWSSSTLASLCGINEATQRLCGTSAPMVEGPCLWFATDATSCSSMTQPTSAACSTPRCCHCCQMNARSGLQNRAVGHRRRSGARQSVQTWTSAEASWACPPEQPMK